MPFSCNSVWSPPPSKMRKFSFEYCPLSQEISSGIHHLPHFRRVACCSAPILSLCASPNLWSVLMAPLEGWLVTPSPLSAFLLYPYSFTESLTLRVQLFAPSPFSRAGSVPLPRLLVVLDYGSLFMLFILLGGFSLPRRCTGLCFRGRG
jgi:hypothetical protein